MPQAGLKSADFAQLIESVPGPWSSRIAEETAAVGTLDAGLVHAALTVSKNEQCGDQRSEILPPKPRDGRGKMRDAH